MTRDGVVILLVVIIASEDLFVDPFAEVLFQYVRAE